MNVLVTGAYGFIGKNLVAQLERIPECRVLRIGRQDAWPLLAEKLAEADFIYHLAGVNRPQSEDEFRIGNVDLTVQICNQLLALGRSVPFVLASSVQAVLDNPYGISKREAEGVVSRYAEQSGTPVAIYRLPNVFGKWCRPNYNSVVATFCHNIAHDLPILISDPARELQLVYIDDVVRHFLQELRNDTTDKIAYRQVTPIHTIVLGELAALIHTFRQMRQSLLTPNFAEPLTYKLYATYLAYLSPDHLAYELDKKCDPRGSLAEFIKASSFGQIFVSRTAPGITRGNHFHHTKTEKFLVLEGEAVIRFRHLHSREIIEYPVRGEEFQVVDIPPGYTHSIENVGTSELVTLFWASEIFDPNQPDTYALSVLS